jgi:ubiquinone/menaquinone biosynthesis C-methylase UbiE
LGKFMANFRQRRAIFDDWAEYYDLVAGDRTPMAAFYCSLVSDRTRSILELACGTGAITLALAQRLVECGAKWEQSRVVGVDESAEMLRIARARDARPEWILGDMRSMSVKGAFDLVICCYNTAQSLLTDNDLTEFFCFVRSIVNPDGVFAFDIIQPDLPYLSRPQEEHLARAITDGRGRRLEHRRNYSYDPRSRILTIDHRLIEAGREDAGALTRLSYGYRQYSTAEIDRALAAAGFAVRQRCGDFDRSDLSAASKKQIFVCFPS